MTDTLSGILAAISTPFAADGSVDEVRLRQHVDFLIENGLHGLTPNGSTGEFAALTVDERKRVNEIVIEQAAGRVPVVAGVGSTSTTQSVELAKHAEQHGASGLLVVAPFYEPPTRDEVIAYYATIANTVSIPVVAYNLPEITGINLDKQFYRDLLQHTGNVKYIKDTSGSMEQALDLIYNLGDELTTFVGLDTILLPAFLSGARGSIWGAPNFAPRECVQIFELAKAGKADEASEIFKRLWNVFDFLGKEGYAVATKGAAKAAGVDLGEPRAPYSPLPAEKQQQLEKLVAEAGISYAD